MKRYTGKHLVLPRMMRTIAVALIPLLLLTSMPVQAWVATEAVAAQAATRARPLPGVAPARPRSPHVEVNRTRPQVTSPSPGLVFSAQPTEAEISRAHVFDEPLLPAGGHAPAQENKALAKALLTYAARADNEDGSAITAFLARYPRSVWRAALLTNLGLAYRKTGYFSNALSAWEEAWRLARNETDRDLRALADRAVGELADLTARLGHDQRLEQLLLDLGSRTVAGPATEKIAAARAGLWQMRHRPEEAFGCGPYALGKVRAALGPYDAFNLKILRAARSSQKGMSLAEIHALAKDVGMNYQMARRRPGARLLLPAVLHWKQGHYAALIREQDGRYLVQDPTVGVAYSEPLWVSQTVLDAEGSGYFLVPADPLPAGWEAVGEVEGGTVWGRGFTDSDDEDATKACDLQVGGDGCDTCKGMARYAFHAMRISLHIVDTPVGYTPPRGPSMDFTVTYNQREASQPAVFTFANLGPKWTLGWIGYVQEPGPKRPPLIVGGGGGGGVGGSRLRSGGGRERYSTINPTTQTSEAQLESQSVLVLTSDNSYEKRFPDGSKEIYDLPNGTRAPREIFMTRAIDPAGNTVRLTYDAQFRLVALTDAIGQVTTLSYDWPGDPLKITAITDPFGRTATFEYDGSDQLIRITDVIGLTSEFSYGAGNFINAMTTPYGTTRFAQGQMETTRWLEATDPLGDTERVEFRHDAPGIAGGERVAPTGIPILNSFLNFRNTFYWDKKAWAEHRGDYTKARLFHWLHFLEERKTAGILESQKKPLENRIWYNYPGQTQPFSLRFVTQARPAKIARVLDDGTTQLYEIERNRLGHITKATDPAGRVFSYVYSDDRIDLLEARQTRGTNNELLAKFTYNAQHLPLTATDAAGQTTRFTYNASGQLLTITNPKNETTTLTYDGNGYLTSVTGPVAGATIRFTYDDYGRVQTLIDSEGYTLRFDYDDLDRVTQVTYPDGTSLLAKYDRLDLVQITDRLGRVTRGSYNARRQLTAIQDALDRVTQFEWCKCGGLQRVIDPMGRATAWNYDVQARVTSKVFPDGRQIRYTYETATSRLKEKLDPNGQKMQYQYYADNKFKQVKYINARFATPSVTFTYDPNYNRILTMEDGTGRTTYTYNPITTTPTLGAGRLSRVTRPLPSATITYAYDELGRVVRRAVDGVATAVTYDALGRVMQNTNPLGTFNYAYVNATARFSSIAYPNGQRTTFSYYDNAGDQRLQEILHRNRDGSVLSKFNYTYNAAGRITSWARQADSQPAPTYAFEYDAADQLIGATVAGGGAGNAMASLYGYDYDAAGNRTAEQVDGETTLSSYNALNQLVGQQTGTLLEPDPVFRSTEVQYDGLKRRVRIVAKEDGAIVSDKRFVWCGRVVCEERDGAGAVTKRFYAQGMQDRGNNYYYTRDHLGSIREMTDAMGAVQARYDYDPYGRRIKVGGDLEADFGFTGHYFHAPSGLSLARHRAYDANLGRWISRDPIGEAGGLNLYRYVLNNPVNYFDLTGKFAIAVEWLIIAVVITVVTYVVLQNYANSAARHPLHISFNSSLTADPDDAAEEPSSNGPIATLDGDGTIVADDGTVTDAGTPGGTKAPDESGKCDPKKDRTVEGALDQLEGISKNQAANRKGGRPDRIKSINKSEQDVRTRLNRIKNISDIEDIEDIE